MPMPLDLVLVRHGQSEANVASRHSREGDHSLFTDEFRKKHDSQYRLTNEGVKQAKAAGKWIRENFKRPYFDRYLTSEYARAMETAALLNLPESKWYIDFFLREREWGGIWQGLLMKKECSSMVNRWSKKSQSHSTGLHPMENRWPIYAMLELSG